MQVHRNTDKKQESIPNARPLFRKQDAIWIVLFVILATVVALLPRLSEKPGSERYAEVYVDNVLVQSIQLKDAGADRFSLEEMPAVELGLDGKGGIFFAASDCPDQRCVHSGTLRDNGAFAACLPNKVMITVKSADPSQEPEADQVDIVIGEVALP